jgi:4-carboxymuconolactone decarboxylase
VSRLQAIDTERLTPEQRKVYDAIASGPRKAVRGPFLALLHVPELASRVQHVGELLRYDTSFSGKLSELAIIVTARGVRCPYEWYAHARIAAEQGLPASVIEAIRTDQTPTFTDANEKLVYEFAHQLVHRRRVSDAAYEAVTKAFGTQGAVELAGIVGYYMMIAMTLNAHDIQPPEKVFAD